mmetsp:Transcript_64025/g.128693  ORF Transcript_64025/g.128693 Transcript_64025/m.128693 type:complete len:209 (+) Transcript_64025:405-1031(+)
MKTKRVGRKTIRWRTLNWIKLTYSGAAVAAIAPPPCRLKMTDREKEKGEISGHRLLLLLLLLLQGRQCPWQAWRGGTAERKPRASPQSRPSHRGRPPRRRQQPSAPSHLPRSAFCKPTTPQSRQAREKKKKKKKKKKGFCGHFILPRATTSRLLALLVGVRRLRRRLCRCWRLWCRRLVVVSRAARKKGEKQLKTKGVLTRATLTTTT